MAAGAAPQSARSMREAPRAQGPGLRRRGGASGPPSHAAPTCPDSTPAGDHGPGLERLGEVGAAVARRSPACGRPWWSRAWRRQAANVTTTARACPAHVRAHVRPRRTPGSLRVDAGDYRVPPLCVRHVHLALHLVRFAVHRRAPGNSEDGPPGDPRSFAFFAHTVNDIHVRR